MSNTPTREQVTAAYTKFLDRHSGDTDAAMADLTTFMYGYTDPAPPDPLHPEMVLDSPAMVGQQIFSQGMPWFAVVQAATTAYAEEYVPQPAPSKIAQFQQWIIEGMQDDPPKVTA